MSFAANTDVASIRALESVSSQSRPHIALNNALSRARSFFGARARVTEYFLSPPGSFYTPDATLTFGIRAVELNPKCRNENPQFTVHSLTLCRLGIHMATAVQ
jgi:hypothetical protein